MRRQTVNKAGIDKLYWEFLEIYVKLIETESILTEEEKIEVDEQFSVALNLAEYYMMNREEVTENDMFFELAESGFIGIKGMYHKFYGKEWGIEDGM